MTGKMSDAKSGLGRFRDAVGRSSLHRHGKLSRDEGAIMDSDIGRDVKGDSGETIDPGRANDLLPADEQRTGASRTVSKTESTLNEGEPQDTSKPSPPRPARVGMLTTSEVVSSPLDVDGQPDFPQPSRLGSPGRLSNPGGVSSDNDSSTDLINKQLDVVGESKARPTSRSTLSLPSQALEESPDLVSARLPRSVSFGVAELVLDHTHDRWQQGVHVSNSMNHEWEWSVENHASIRIKQMIARLQGLENVDMPSARSRLAELERSEAQTRHNFSMLNETFYKRSEEYEALRQDTIDLVGEQRALLDDALKDLEVLGAKLEYELNSLLSKVEDVEDGVNEFERQVQYLDERIADLEEEESRDQPWYRRLSRLLVGEM